MRRKNAAFTLMELIVTMAVLLIIMSVAMVYYGQYRDSYGCKNAAELAAYYLKTMQQKTITCELESGIYVKSDREYWVYTADIVNPEARGFMLAGGVGDEPPMPSITPSYPQHYAPGGLPLNMNIVQKVYLDNIRITMPPVGGRTYFHPRTTTNTGMNIHWKVATPYVYPNEIAGPLTILMVLRSRTVEKQIVVDQDGKIYVW